MSRDERGEDFLKLHFVAPERPYTGISTPTARDNEASTGPPPPFREGERHTPVGPSSQRAAHGDIIDIREEQKGGGPVAVPRGERGRNYLGE